MPGNSRDKSARGEAQLPAAAADALARLRQRTPARLVVGRAGGGYLTGTQLALREDHAAAVDAVQTELDMARDFDAEFVRRWRLFEVTTLAADKSQFLKRPGLGRRFSPAAGDTIRKQGMPGSDLQVVIGDGLSAAAVVAQVPALLPLLADEATRRGWAFARPFVVRHCRVGILNEVGELLDPQVVVLLIGERPGLVTAESLSAYMAFRPRNEHTDANRNLISNVHARGVLPKAAAARILGLAEQMRVAETSGVAIKESLADNLAGGQQPKLKGG